jgi:dihydrofolate reductase
MRKLKYHVATTLDGFIAHEDQTVDGFLGEGDHASDYLASLHSDYDVVIMGRKTYEFGLKLGVTNPYPWLEQYVFSRTLKESPDEAVKLVSDDSVALVKRLKAEDGKDIYLCGGADLATLLLNEKLIDEIIVKLNPVLFGSGISLLSRIPSRVALELKSSKTYSNGVVLLSYHVKT